MNKAYRTRIATPTKAISSQWSQTLRIVLAAVGLAVLAGCSAAVTKLETWEGSPATAVNAATLEAPGEITVTHVNGRKMTNFLMDDLALDYALLPGENEVVFSYKTIWAKSEVVRNGESKVHVIKSKPQVVRFEASPNATYRFDYEKPGSRREAEKVMPGFSARIVGAEGQVLASSTDWSPEDSARSARTPLPAGQSVEDNDGTTALNRLKAVWETASDEEKKAFLRWAFE